MDSVQNCRLIWIKTANIKMGGASMQSQSCDKAACMHIHSWLLIHASRRAEPFAFMCIYLYDMLKKVIYGPCITGIAPILMNSNPMRPRWRHARMACSIVWRCLLITSLAVLDLVTPAYWICADNIYNRSTNQILRACICGCFKHGRMREFDVPAHACMHDKPNAP